MFYGRSGARRRRVDAARDAIAALATKEDLERLRVDLMKDLTVRFGVMLAAAVGILAAILKAA